MIPPERTPSQQYIVRIWFEEDGHGRQEWRGEVRDIQQNERRYFRTWSEMVSFVTRSFPASVRR